MANAPIRGESVGVRSRDICAGGNRRGKQQVRDICKQREQETTRGTTRLIFSSQRSM